MTDISAKYVHIRDNPTFALMFVPEVTPPSKGGKDAAPTRNDLKISDDLEEGLVNEDTKSDRIACHEIEKNVELLSMPHHAIPTTRPDAVIEI